MKKNMAKQQNNNVNIQQIKLVRCMRRQVKQLTISNFSSFNWVYFSNL